jgi:hypothetical protein
VNAPFQRPGAGTRPFLAWPWRTLWFAAAALALASGCGSAASAPDDGGPLFVPPPPPARDSGCVVIRELVEDGGCRVDRLCPATGAMTFACLANDGGVTCVCTAGEETTAAPMMLGPNTCLPSRVGSVGALATRICKWPQ